MVTFIYCNFGWFDSAYPLPLKGTNPPRYFEGNSLAPQISESTFQKITDFWVVDSFSFTTCSPKRSWDKPCFLTHFCRCFLFFGWRCPTQIFASGNKNWIPTSLGKISALPDLKDACPKFVRKQWPENLRVGGWTWRGRIFCNRSSWISMDKPW